ncbi:MAG: cyclopropane fatty acyl phospholipid synthase [Candidatus Omnitrophica bacterium]|nr:cyclopropane fatty acyl phospholipid synthase [Candidatus Omnitrophota bacterium]
MKNSLREQRTYKNPNIIDISQYCRSLNSLKGLVERIFNAVDIRINGERPWDVQVRHEGVYQRVISQGSLGLGEAYMDGWWDCENLDEAFFRVIRAEQEGRFRLIFPFSILFSLFISDLKSKILNHQRLSEAFMVGERHYDIGNDLYRSMLDKRMVYTCAYWENARDLDEAQEFKLDLVCRKLQLRPGMHVLDIGCGWGSFAKYAAQQYGVKVTGITISHKQVELAQETCRGLPIDIQLKDYRDFSGTFDRIVSLGMFEHVGYKNYRTYMQMVARSLKDDGLFLLQTIGSNKSTTSYDLWLNKYIFPNALIPSIEQIGQSYEGLLVMEDWQNFSAYYDQTLMVWFKNFNTNWYSLRSRYGDKFYRMWRYYLLSCAGLFRARRLQLWQIVFSKYGIPKGYRRI